MISHDNLYKYSTELITKEITSLENELENLGTFPDISPSDQTRMLQIVDLLQRYRRFRDALDEYKAAELLAPHTDKFLIQKDIP